MGALDFLLSKIGLSPTSGRVIFERGLSSGGFYETVFRCGRWVVAISYDTKHFGDSRSYQISIRKELTT